MCGGKPKVRGTKHLFRWGSDTLVAHDLDPAHDDDRSEAKRDEGVAPPTEESVGVGMIDLGAR
jgi:hypothetical protein